MSLDQLMAQAQELQEKMRQAQEDLVSTEVQGEAGGGLVKVTLNGRHDVVDLFVSPTLFQKAAAAVSDGGEGGGESPKALVFMQDLIKAAFNDAVQKIEEKAKTAMTDLAQGMQLPPDFKLPDTNS